MCEPQHSLPLSPRSLTFSRKKYNMSGIFYRMAKDFPALAKTEAVEKWDHKTITTVKQLKGFLGLVGWYQVYIPKFAELATPLIEAPKQKYQYSPPDPTDEKTDTNVPKKRKHIKLTAKEAHIEWSDVMVKHFTALKQALMDATGLYLPKPGQPWRIRCDASHYALQGALSQQQEDGEYHPVAFFSRKLGGQRAGTGAGKRDTGHYAWTPRENETYAAVACLLTFQAWIASQEGLVQTDHRSMVKWYKEDLCTISGPLGCRGRWHELLSQFNLTIQYRPGDDNDGADALRRWAYPAGEAQDTNFHGSDADLEGWRHDERDEWHGIPSKLKSQKQFQFREEQAMVSLLQSARVQAVKCVHSPFCVLPDGSVSDSSDDVCRRIFSMHFFDDPDLGQGLSDLSWHMPGVERLCQDIKSIKVPPAISILSVDRESHYADDPFMADHWGVLNRDKAISVKGKDYALYQGKVRVDGRIYVPLALTDQVLRVQHSYAHPGVQKALEMFRRRYVSGHTDADLGAKTSAMIGSCAVCKTCKARRGLQAESCHSFPTPEYPFSSISMAFCDMGQENATEIRGVTYDYLFVVVCRLTGYTMAIPCSRTITAPQSAELYLERVVGLRGLPNEIFSDHDHLITADFFMTLCDLTRVQQKQSPIYRPRSNERSERAVQVVLDV